MFGTKCPSMISTCSQSDPWSSFLEHSWPNWAKSALRIDGAMIAGGPIVVGLRRVDMREESYYYYKTKEDVGVENRTISPKPKKKKRFQAVINKGTIGVDLHWRREKANQRCFDRGFTDRWNGYHG